MAWKKKNLIFKTNGSFEWSKTHAQVPTALLIDDKIRIYYATRDNKGRSLTSYIDVDKDNPSYILHVSDKPILDLGNPGTHDEDGVMAGCVVRDGDTVLMYYTGWSKCQTVPYKVTIGIARSFDQGSSFERIYEGPVVDRTALEPYMTMSPYIIRDGKNWHMWYGSGTKWVNVDDKMEPVYVIKYAHSHDGLKWTQENQTCIAPLHDIEANTRPSVYKTQDGYEMWFSYRDSVDFRQGKGGYRIGYATSQDGLNWQRKQDPSGLGTTDHSWDSQMIAYPNVLEVNGKKIMFYNGNGFGQSGFGYAVWEE